MSKSANPWFYVPSLYFAEGLPYVIVNTVSVIMYKNMGLSNEFIGLTSILYLPWVLKMAWSPFVDLYRTRRTWIIGAQALLCVLCALLALSLPLPLFVGVSLAIFILMAFASATNDVATDGYYMLALDTSKQAFFLGVRSTSYRLAMVFGAGLLVVLAGELAKRTGSMPRSWAAVMGCAAAISFVLVLFHGRYLPRPAADSAGAVQADRFANFAGAFKTYFQQPGIVPILGFILLFRLGEAMLVKMTAPFLLDGPDLGGMGLATETVGYIYGTVGVICLSVGGILGGWLIARFGLKRCIWPMAFLLNAPDLLYLYMAVAKPAVSMVYWMVGFEQFGYGVGFTAFSVYLMYIARKPYKTSHFAISTGFMALGMMLPGMVSGMVQQWLGYVNFFIIVVVLTVPGMALIGFIPLDNEAAGEISTG